MNHETDNRVKRILSDPIAYYMQAVSNSTQNDLAKLRDLCESLDKLKARYQEIDEQTRKLSREIGKCKKSGDDCKNLIALMKSYSAEKSGLNIHIQDLENKIISFFGTVSGTQNSNNTLRDSPDTYSHPARDVELGGISIWKLENDEQEWNAYVASIPSAKIYHLAQWRSLIENTFGHKTHYLYAVDTGGAIRGILPLVQLNSRLFGNFLVSMPYFNYGGAVADHPDIELRLMAEAASLASELGAGHVEFRDSVSRQDYPVRTDKVNMVLALTAEKQELWNSFKPKLRAQIRRPQREKPVIHIGGEELLDHFYKVFARNMRDLGTPVYGKSLFKNILNYFSHESRIISISINGQPVAAAFLIGYRDTLEIPWASTNRNFNHLGINMLMYWEVLKYAVETGYKLFDFGRSSINSGTYKFKKQWGAMPRQSYWHYWLPSGHTLPALNPDNPKYKLAIKVWKHMPIALTRIIGPMIVRNIP